MAIHVVNEARRCLHCKKPMCREGCPISTNIPEAIELFRTGHKEEAGEMLYENNPLSVICSLVCDHEKQCEGHCVLGRKGAPVHFSSIENYISDAYLDHLEPEMEPKKGQRVAIIGSGPAGITISVLLARRGYDVTIFESREKIGGVLRYGIPEFRLPKSILDRYQKQLIKLGIKIRPNTAIGRTLTVDDLQRDGYEAIFIGTGVWKPKAMGIPGESLGHVNYAIDYLVDPDVYDLGDNLVVIGAGNSAMDVARTALRKACAMSACSAAATRPPPACVRWTMPRPTAWSSTTACAPPALPTTAFTTRKWRWTRKATLPPPARSSSSHAPASSLPSARARRTASSAPPPAWR